MSLVAKDKDTWDNTIPVASLGNYPLGMYFYYSDSTDLVAMSAIIGNCNAIHSCYFTPFIDSNDLEMWSIPYDKDRFGKIVGSTLDYNPPVSRIMGFNFGGGFDKYLGSFVKYKSEPRSNYRNWRNEGRLYNFPYMYAILSDGINTPLEIHYHEIPTPNNIAEIYANAMITDKGTYSIYVKGNKGDYTGQMESLISTAPTEIPVSSSAYSQWSSTQKAQDNQNIRASLMQLGLANQQTQQLGSLAQEQTQANALFGGANAVVGGVSNALQGNVGGAFGSVMGGIQGAVNSMYDYQKTGISMNYSNRNLELAQANAIGGRNALLKDLTNTPRTMISTGSDIGFSLKRQNGVKLFRYKASEEYLSRLGDYFAMFGYKQSKTMTPSIRDRYYYNYIKTIGANILPKEGMPKSHLEVLKNIFDNGVTVWHMDRDGVYFMDYTYDNREVN